MQELDCGLQEQIALRFGRECADEIRDLLLDGEENQKAIGLSRQRRLQFESDLGRRVWRAWNRFRDASVAV